MKIFWLGILSLFVGLIVWQRSEDQPHIRRIDLGTFAGAQQAIEAISNELKVELQERVWIWGINPADPFQAAMIGAIAGNQSSLPPVDELWQDEELEMPLLMGAKPIQFKPHRSHYQALIQQNLVAGKRVMIVTATPYAASFLKGSPASEMAATIPMLTILVAEFPRRREDESKVAFQCILPHSDLHGIGELGCQIQQKARNLYRKTLERGARVGLMDKVSKIDFLFLTAKEP